MNNNEKNDFNANTDEISIATDNNDTQKLSSINIKNRYLLFLTAIIIILFDQGSKNWISNNLSMSHPINVFGDYLRLFLAHNYALVWSIPIRNDLVYYILPSIGIIVVIFIAFRTRIVYYSLSFGFILGGAVGNLIDRVRIGYVIDFIDMGIKNTRWPTYNIADLAIDVGLIMIIAREIFVRDRNKKLLG
jgi:signal peptidase II